MFFEIRLKPGREKPVAQRHPWVFSGAISGDRALTGIEPGEIVNVCDHKGRFLARGYYNEKSQIRVRILSWDEAEVLDQGFWRKRLSAAIKMRKDLGFSSHTNAYRLINSEADLLPGLIVDRYDQWLVVQALTAGIERALNPIVQALSELTGIRNIYNRSDDYGRKLEGLDPSVGVILGKDPPPENIVVLENNKKFHVDIKTGHKTGFYLDQRESRAAVGSLAKDRQVLNCFCYTGGFSVYCAGAGAKSVTSVDSSEPALKLANLNLRANSHEENCDFIQGDVFEVLRAMRERGRTFDLIILDPPKFAHNAGQIQKAARGYKDLNILAFQLLSKGGLLATFSCSGLITEDLFQKIVFSAALDAGVDAQIQKRLGQSADHPILLTFPESAYLKGLLCRKL